jgi:WD40 repeat protein
MNLLLPFLVVLIAGLEPTGGAASLTALAYAPKGDLLAVARTGQVWLLDTNGYEINDAVAGLGPKVTALVFNPAGTQLAIAHGTPGQNGRIELVAFDAKGARTAAPPTAIAAHKDLIHALAFSPDGKTLASCGYDRVIHLWDAASGKLVHTLKDHSDAVYAVAFHPKQPLLFSAAADRTVKVWNVATGQRLYTLGDATDWLYALAISPDGQNVAAAGVDKSIRVWSVTAKEGKLAQSVFAHEGPVLHLAYSPDGKLLYSLAEDRRVKVWDTAKLVEKAAWPQQPDVAFALAIRPKSHQLALARFDGRLTIHDAAEGKVLSEPLPTPFGFHRASSGTSPDAVAEINLPALVRGHVERAGSQATLQFTAAEGYELGAWATPLAAGKLEPHLELTDAAGRVLAESSQGALGYKIGRAGTYRLRLRDAEYRGGKDFGYRLKVGPVPVITAWFPLGVRRGTEATIQLEGVNLGPTRQVRIAAPESAVVGTRLPLPVTTPMGPPVNPKSVVVGEFPEPADLLEIGSGHGTVNGVVDGQRNPIWRFRAKRGEKLVIEIEAARLGSRLDSILEILDEDQQPLPRALLRSVAKTYVTFRDHAASVPGIRLETWGELAIGDLLYVGNELMKIRALPKNPDDDCQFEQVAGQRRGYLGTTPTYHANGTVMYKVEVHPPTATFPPNGYPTHLIAWRNDDGGAGFGKDSVLYFEAPRDGVFGVRVGDAQGRLGSDLAYRLTVRPPRPDFTVDFNPKQPSVSKGQAVPIFVTVRRQDDYEGPVGVELQGLPPGFSAPATFIPAEEQETAFALYAEPASATPTAGAEKLRLVAKATILGREVVRTVHGEVPKLIDLGDLVTQVDRHDVAIAPGGQARLTVRIERRNQFKGRVPLEVRGLPPGVRVLDIGLNGILITEKETARTITLFAEPWVPRQEHPLVISAKRDGKNTEHAARSVLLRVEASTPAK